MLGVCRIFAGISGSPGSVHALRHAAGLARRHDAVLVPLLAWVPPGGNLRAAVHLPEDSRASRGPHPGQARRAEPC
jgi:hypothetical protein